jgi:hypothetical protein
MTTPLWRIPWRKVLLALALAAFIAWAVGFVIGLVVRFAYGF